MTARRTITLDADGRRRLRASIAHWERLATGTAKEGESTGPLDCALCKRWLIGAESPCSGGCPIYQWTGKKYCVGTPYRTAANALGIHRFPAAAKKMLAFLEKLEKRVVKGTP